MLLDRATIKRPDNAKITSKKVSHETREARGKLRGTKTAEKIFKSKLLATENSGNVEEVVILLEKE